MRLIYMIAADVLRALGWEVEIKEKDSYWNLVLTNTTSSEDMPQSHKSCLRGLLRGWLMEFLFEGGRQQVNIYKDLHGLDPEDDRYSCLDTCANRTDGNTPQHKLDDREIFIRRKDRFDRYVLTEPISEAYFEDTPRCKCKQKTKKEEAILNNLVKTLQNYEDECYRQMAFMNEHKFEIEREAIRYKQQAFNRSWLEVSSAIDKIKALKHEAKGE